MKRIIYCLSLFLITSCTMANDVSSDRKSLENYAKTVVSACRMGDGYHCVSVKEDDFFSVESVNSMLPGQYLQAWESAHAAFSRLPELTIEQRDLKHYRVGFTESPDSYIVLFMPLLLPQVVKNNQPIGVGTAAFGKTVKFWLDKRTFKVTRHLFYK